MRQQVRQIPLVLGCLFAIQMVACMPRTEQPVDDVLTRVLGVAIASQFELVIDSSMKQGFSVSTTNTTLASGICGSLNLLRSQ